MKKKNYEKSSFVLFLYNNRATSQYIYAKKKNVIQSDSYQDYFDSRNLNSLVLSSEMKLVFESKPIESNQCSSSSSVDREKKMNKIHVNIPTL